MQGISPVGFEENNRRRQSGSFSISLYIRTSKSNQNAMSNKHIRFDWAIKRMLRQKANFGILEGFLSELLGFDITIQSIGESEGNQTDKDDKYNRVDILAETASKELILIEVQNDKKHNYFHRMNYGQAKLITDYMNTGDEYEQVRKVYSVNIVYFELGQGDDYVYKGGVDFYGLHRPGDKLQLSSHQKNIYGKQHPGDIFATYYILKINTFNDIAKDGLDQWIYFFKNNEFPENISAKGLKLAQERLRTDNLPPDQKEEYEQFMKYVRDRESEISTAFYDGQESNRSEKEAALAREAEALALAERERAEKESALAETRELQRKTVLQFAEMGLDGTKITAITGLSAEEIRAILS